MGKPKSMPKPTEDSGKIRSKRQFFKYSSSKLKDAINAVNNGQSSVLNASKTYNIPRTTLRNKLSGKSPLDYGKVGPECVLGSRVENMLENWLLECCRMGHPINQEGLCLSVKQLVEAEQMKVPFTDNIPGRKWFDCFMNRHPTIAKKKAEYLSKSRANVTPEFIRKWFSDVTAELKEFEHILNFPKRIWNMDETGICTGVQMKVCTGFFIMI